MLNLKLQATETMNGQFVTPYLFWRIDSSSRVLIGKENLKYATTCLKHIVAYPFCIILSVIENKH